MLGTNVSQSSSSSNKQNKPYNDFEYISNDPAENADNFDPKWNSFRQMKTDEERYESIRKRWGNSNTPNPNINLSHINTDKPSSSGRAVAAGSNCQISDTENIRPDFIVKNSTSTGRKTAREASNASQRSRSCTSRYEKLIMDLERNYLTEINDLMCRNEMELQQMLRLQSLVTVDVFKTFPSMMQILQDQQKEQLKTLLQQQSEKALRIRDKSTERIEVYKRYVEEIKTFSTFYQKMIKDKVTLEMSDDQYIHTVETERMYNLYNKFYK